MRLDDESESTNYEIRSGRGGGGFGLPVGIPLGRGGLGCGSLILIGIISLVLGVNPLTLLGDGGGQGPVVQQQSQPGEAPGSSEEKTPVMSRSLKVLGSTERVWGRLFQEQGGTYQPTILAFYSGGTEAGCGFARSAMGPFYCPADKRIFLDTSFFDELSGRFGAPGDFAQAYVIAHEVGHHVQDLEGTLDKVHAAQNRLSEREANALQVKVELQADCYAGVWAAQDRNLLEPGDAEAGLRAAAAVGDDTLQKASQGYVVPEGFTHGSAADRQKWLRIGLDSGDPARCDTFGSRGP
ncbi:KPN_02809 family neutral zinc metallopeptidase [Rhizorhabdus histidinilytica]|uniref:KPN_02809 family neutral zinc metallopeptidase n=1 Tax=Rhizorhabdus histidinilytica TaxID=439228 RepID=UPI00321FC1DE